MNESTKSKIKILLEGDAINRVSTNKETHVWQVWNDFSEREIKEFSEILSAEEKTRALKFHFKKDQLRFTASRALLRILLEKYLGKKPPEFSYTKEGKPYLHEQILNFNVSHSHEAIIFAFAHQRIGIDIEKIKPIPDCENLAKRFFTATEFEVLKQTPAEQKELAFFNIWTQKEAVLKALGIGITGLEKIEVEARWDHPPKLIRADNLEIDLAKWQLHTIKTFAGFHSTLAVENNSGLRVLNFNKLSISESSLVFPTTPRSSSDDMLVE